MNLPCGRNFPVRYHAGIHVDIQNNIVAIVLAKLKAPQLLELARKAGTAWQKAGARPGEYVSLTTCEYQAMRAGLRAYFRALPKIEVGTYRQACNVADQVMK